MSVDSKPTGGYVDRVPPADGAQTAWTPRYVVVEGVIGVGKTTLVHQLARRLRARMVLERFEENPFLADFYRDPESNALPTQLFFLMSRFRQQEQLAQGDLFAQMTVSDYMFDKDRLFALLTLSAHELAIYEDLFSVLRPQVPQPDLVVLLRADNDETLRRIADRGRSYERNIDPAYIAKLADAYQSYFARYAQCPVLTLDTSAVDLRADDAAVEEVVQAVRTGRRPARIPAEVSPGETPLLPGFD